MRNCSAFVWLIAITTVVASPRSSRAAILPSPDIEQLCREADLIVDGEQFNGDRVMVSRVLKCPPGYDPPPRILQVRHLHEMNRQLGFEFRPGPPIATRRGVFFLTRDFTGTGWIACGTARAEREIHTGPGVFWYDAVACYGYDQMMNPGPYELRAGEPNAPGWDIPPNRDALEKQIQIGLQLSDEWEALLNLDDPAEQAKGFARFLLPRTAPHGYHDSFARELRTRMALLGEPAVPPIVKLLEEVRPDDDLNDAVLILSDMGSIAQARHRPSPTAAALPALRRLLEAPSRTARYYIVCAIRSSRGRRAIPDVRALLADKDQQVAKEAADALAELEALPKDP
jgi:hypothetical protein